jgi:hypothetical protein
MKYGYARTSTDDQTTALQRAALKRARCSYIYEDKRVPLWYIGSCWTAVGYGGR